MTLAPLLAAPSVIQVHAFAAMAAFPLGLLQFAAPKAAHRHDVAQHRRVMIGIFIGALVIAGAFTLLPGRIMSRVVFGG